MSFARSRDHVLQDLEDERDRLAQRLERFRGLVAELDAAMGLTPEASA